MAKKNFVSSIKPDRKLQPGDVVKLTKNQRHDGICYIYADERAIVHSNAESPGGVQGRCVIAYAGVYSGETDLAFASVKCEDLMLITPAPPDLADPTITE